MWKLIKDSWERLCGLFIVPEVESTPEYSSEWINCSGENK